jgi:hypothetical protein
VEQHDAVGEAAGVSNGLFTPPMYSQMYRLSTQPESNDKGKWFGWEVERIGTVDEQGLYETAKHFSQSVSSGTVKVKHEGEEGAERGRKCSKCRWGRKWHLPPPTSGLSRPFLARKKK